MIYVQVNTDKFQAAVKRLLDTIGPDITQANREVSINLYSWVIRNFDSEGGNVGGWAPLAPRTVREKERLGKQKMLVRSGALRASFVPFYDSTLAGVGASVAKFREGAKTVVTGKNREGKKRRFAILSTNTGDYAKFLEYGTSRMPARHMLPPMDAAREIATKVYNRQIKTTIQNSGLA